jgi:hypothetical protein
LEGRHHFQYRLAMVVQDREHAMHVLKQALTKEKTPNVFWGIVPREFTGQKALEQYAEDLLKQSWSLRENSSKYQETLFVLADLHCQGYQFDWQMLFGENKPERIHLPTYPFAREEYWVSKIIDPINNGTAVTSAAIHPLLQQNTSNLAEQQYTSTFTGEEFFLADHVVGGRRILSEIAGLEMARAAVMEAASSSEDGRGMIRLKNVIWSRPIEVREEPLRVHIGLFPEENGEIGYEIYSKAMVAEGEPVIYSLKTVRDQCTRNTFSAAEIYEAFQSIGIDYGPGYRSIEAIYTGRGQILAKLALDPSVSGTKELFVLHPGIMDSALQAAIGFLMGTGNLKPINPGILNELEVFGEPPSPCWVLIRDSRRNEAGDKPADDKQLQMLDIDLCDEQGTVLVRMKGLETKANIENDDLTAIEPVFQNNFVSTEEAYELMTFEEAWQKEALPKQDSNLSNVVSVKTLVCFLSSPENQQQLTEIIRRYNREAEIIFISQSKTYQKQSPQNYCLRKTDRNMYGEVFRSIHDGLSKDSGDGIVDAILYLWPLEDPNCIKDYSGIVYLMQAMGSAKLATKRIHFAAQFNIDGIERCYAESWIGFERSLRMILQNVQISAIYQAVSPKTPIIPIEDWGHKLWAEMQNMQTQSVLYQGNDRLVYRVQPTTIQSGNSLLKPGGTYLITGGCGGLGLLFAKYLAKASSKTEPVKLILTGRSPLDDEKQSKINILEALGSKVIYLQADVSDAVAMREGLNLAVKRFGNINGVIHAAGINEQQVIFESEIQSFLSVLDPKVKGTLLLDELLKDEPLDFICYFSSTSAVIGDFGSCDYSIANRFLMAYAEYRNRRQQKGELGGKAVVISWPLWRDGGMGFGEWPTLFGS